MNLKRRMLMFGWIVSVFFWHKGLADPSSLCHIQNQKKVADIINNTRELKGLISYRYHLKDLNSWTNQVFLIEPLNTSHPKYILRIPRNFKERLLFKIPAVCEYSNIMKAHQSNILTSDVLYYDHQGVFLFRYLKHTRVLGNVDFKDERIIASAAQTLKKLHQTPIRLVNDKDIFMELHKTKKLLERYYPKNLPKNFNKTMKELERIGKIYHLANVLSVPCHGDPSPSNFLVTQSGIALIDWEYSGNGDPSLDLAILANTSELSDEASESLLRAYSSKDPTFRERFIINRVLVYFWHFFWFRLQPIVGSTLKTKNEFISLGNLCFDRGIKGLNSLDFQRALDTLHQPKE
jgi:thiamine kinase-like enzyme